MKKHWLLLLGFLIPLAIGANYTVFTDLKATGEFAVEGAVNLDGALVRVGGGSYATATGDGDLGVADALEVDGATRLDGALTVAGNITANGNLTGDGATVLSGMIASVSTTQGSRSLLAADSQKVITNDDAPATYTLPTSVAGLVYTVLVTTATTTYIDCAASDRIFGTNADGDRLSNATAGDTITLVGVGTSGTYNWYPLTKTGTWSDAN